MLLRWIGFLVILFLGLAAFRTPAPPAAARYSDQPPPAHTGGFGEPTCHQCHFDAALDAPGGALALSGVPETYTPDSTYRLTVTLKKEGMALGGFELAVRFAEGAQAGRQAGALRPVNSARVEITPAGSPAVQYAHHTLAGSAPSNPGTVQWTLKWIPPDTAHGPVVFHAAANAANDDASAFGDFVYTQRAKSHAAQPK